MAEKSLKKRIPQGDDYRPFINLSWTQTQEADFEEWLRDDSLDKDSLDLITRVLADSYSLKLGLFDGSWCVTLENQTRKAAGQPYLLSGWSDSWQDALAVAYYKLYVLLEGDWEHPFASTVKSRRR